MVHRAGGIVDIVVGDDDFFDQSHLSEIGAEKFTKILKHDLRKKHGFLI